ncbi:MAG TPA: DUF2235 domain-containing protein [Lysobacter sp.]
MGSKHGTGEDTYPADAWDIDSYRRAEEEMAQMRIPQFLREANPHDRLFITGLDGTGNSKYKESPERWSVVAKANEHLIGLSDDVKKYVAAGYVQGTFTQDNPLLRYPDGAFGHSFEERVETAYYQFCEQAGKWLREDPQAQIRIVGVGFSRGAEEVAALTRMVHERGIQNPETAEVRWNQAERIVTHVAYHGPPLIPPGQTLQAALLLDPVSTGVTEHDRRLAPSVVSALQITAQDERRDQFKSNLLLQPGVSEDGRFANVLVGGAHSDVGDTYTTNGLGTLSYNASVAFLNRFSDTPLLERRQEPEAPSMYAVHRSDRGSILWTARSFRDGARDTRDDLAPSSACAPVTAEQCRRREPADPALGRRADELTPAMPRSLHEGAFETREQRELREFSERMERMIGAADRGEWGSFRRDQQELANSDNGRRLIERSSIVVDRWEEQVRMADMQRMAEIQAQQQAAQEQQRSHSRGFAR